MQIRPWRLEIQRKRPLTISRGTASATENLFIEVSHDGVIGNGEAAPIGYGDQNAPKAEADLNSIAHELEGVSPCQIQAVEVRSQDICTSARAALINASYDWTGKRLGVPVYRLLGLEPKQVRTSITVGINPPGVVRELAKQLTQEVGTDELKLKLGSPDGIEADKENYLAAAESGAKMRVDANGGWSVTDACAMLEWLAAKGCGYVEQPLGFGLEDGLAEVRKVRRIPVFLDEFICTASDVARFANVCDGINVKLLKSGGIAEAVRCVHVARALGLKTMIGCFSESSLGIAGGAHIGSLFDYIDLDSHLNMAPDPAFGLGFEDGGLVPSEKPGLGVEFR